MLNLICLENLGMISVFTLRYTIQESDRSCWISEFWNVVMHNVLKENPKVIKYPCPLLLEWCCWNWQCFVINLSFGFEELGIIIFRKKKHRPYLMNYNCIEWKLTMWYFVNESYTSSPNHFILYLQIVWQPTGLTLLGRGKFFFQWIQLAQVFHLLNLYAGSVSALGNFFILDFRIHPDPKFFVVETMSCSTSKWS